MGRKALIDWIKKLGFLLYTSLVLRLASLWPAPRGSSKMAAKFFPFVCVSPRYPILVVSVVYRGFIELRNGMRYNKMAANLELPRGARARLTLERG